MKVLVVGHGRMGKNHARVLRELGEEVVTLDPDPKAGAEWQSPHAQKLGSFDAAVIAVPIPKLAEVAESAIELKMDVLVEKPGASSYDELLDLHAFAERHGRRLLVGFVERHNPAVQALRSHLRLIGRLQHVSIRRLGFAVREGDPMLDLATHDLDLLAHLGLRLSIAGASVGTRHFSALLYEPDGPTASIEASHLHPVKIRTLEAVGTQGVIQLDFQRQEVVFIAHNADPITVPVEEAEPLALEWQAFAAGQGSDGLGALRVIEDFRNDRVAAI